MSSTSDPARLAERRQAAGHTPGRQIARNFLSLALPEPINRIARFMAAIVLARGLILHDYSLVNVGVAAAGIGVEFTSIGLSEIGARDIAVNHDHASWLASRIVSARAVVLVGVVAVCEVIALFVAPDDVAFIAAVGGMALCSTVSAEWILRGKERMRALGLSSAAGGLTVLAGSVVAVALDRSAVTGMIVFALGEAIATTICWFAARPISFRPARSGLPPLVRRSWPVALSTIAFQAYYASLDTLIIAGTRSTDQAGLYSAAYRVFLTLNIVAIFAAQALLPLLARARVAEQHEFADALLARSLWPLAAYGMSILGVAELVSRPIMAGLFGARFGSMQHVLVVLCIGLLWYVVGYPSGYAFIASQQNRRYLVGAVVAAVTDVAVDLCLVPLFGPIGAAVGMALALSGACLVWFYLHRFLTGAGMRLVVLLLLATAGAVLGEVVSDTRMIVGIITLIGGLALGSVSIRRVAPSLRVASSARG